MCDNWFVLTNVNVLPTIKNKCIFSILFCMKIKIFKIIIYFIIYYYYNIAACCVRSFHNSSLHAMAAEWSPWPVVCVDRPLSIMQRVNLIVLHATNYQPFNRFCWPFFFVPVLSEAQRRAIVKLAVTENGM